MKKSSIVLIFLTSALFLNSCKKDKVEDLLANCGKDAYMCTVAGKGEAGAGGNGGKALDALMYWPQDMYVDASENVFILDWNNHCVRKVTTDGIINNLIGSGFLGDGTSGDALNINLNHPTDFMIMPDGNYLLTSWHNWKLKVINSSTNIVSVLAGTSQGFSGDSAMATTAQFNLPSSTVIDGNGDLYISDEGNQRIRKINTTTGMITTIAGDGTKSFADGIGTAAKFYFPFGSDAIPGGKLAISNDKNFIYIADTYNNRIRKLNISTNEVTTIAGTGTAGYSGDGSSAISAQLNSPTDVAVGPDNSIYIADRNNNVIRKIDVNGNISTVAGNGTAGFSESGSLAKQSMLHHPSGVFVTAANVLYIADTENHQIKKVINP